MREGPDIAHIAALIGDPARANMLTALMSGKALTVSELAEEAGVTIQTASSHLSKLDEGGLLRPRKQGRHKYFSRVSDEVAHVLEGLMGLAAGSGYLRKRTGPRDAELRALRFVGSASTGVSADHIWRAAWAVHSSTGLRSWLGPNATRKRGW